MKKTFLTAFAALLVAIPAVQAQKVNKSGLLTKIEKSDADIADAKKNAKASTWINRGKALYEAAVEPTKSLFVNMDAAMLKLAVGEPSATKQVTLLNVPYEAWEYPYFIAYIKDGKVVTWTQTDWVLKEAPAMAIEAYNKAYEIDPKSAAKAKDGLQQISDFCSQVGNTGIDTGEYVAAADAYATAFRAQSSPAYGAAADPALLYYAGYLRTVDGSAHPSSFGQGAEYLKKAIDLGYTDEEGNIYYYLFHCYYGLKNVSQDNVMLAKDALITGIGKFPKNERILDGLMQLYTAEEGVGDPADLVTLIDSAIADNPENVDLWFGRGRIFYALKNYDEKYFANVHRLAVTDKPLYHYLENPASATHRYMRDYPAVFARFLERKAEIVEKYGLDAARPQWRANTVWAGLLIAVGNEYVKSNPKPVREKRKAVEALCAQPEFAKAIRELRPKGLGRNKQIVADLIGSGRFGTLTALYRLKNHM